ncbi:MAG TPA: hypothetical protein VMU45_13370 [Candidatus Eisenbacteria bacterium]|nr:hypothetical protein [Candidatus Eisenbacteria bacterium]
MLNYPVVFSVLSLIVLWLAAQAGAALRRRRPLHDVERDDFGLVETATLTLLGLIIGFSFSMATTRYDLRKNYEEAEANAIGTEFVRAGLLPAGDAAVIRSQLRQYTELRIAFYRTRRSGELQQIDNDTAKLQAQMWAAVEAPALAQPTPVAALAVSGMNDVLNSQGYTQAAWWNRIPRSAWGLMISIAVASSFMVGYGARVAKVRSGLLFVVPLVVSIAFLLISDIDSPRHGLIHVVPQNLVSLLQSLPGQ